MPGLIQPAYLALSPALYWPLQETSGAVAADVSGHGRAGAISGDIGFGLEGPEVGTNSLRLFPSGRVDSPALGFTGVPTISWAVYASTAKNSNTTNTNVLGFVAAALRGLVLRVQGTGTLNANWNLGFIGRSGAANGPVAQPFEMWHSIVATFDASTSGGIIYVDGVQTGLVTFGAGGSNLVATDPLTLQSAYAMSVSHVAMWTRVLTSTEASGIGQYYTQWPYITPLQVPISVSGLPVDLTPVETDVATLQTSVNALATTVTALQTTVNTLESQVTGIVTTTFPSLNTLLGQIFGGVQATIVSGASTFTATLGQLFSGHVPQDWTETELTTGCTGGSVTFLLDYFIFGIRVVICTFPPGEGRSPLGGDYYKPAFAAVRIRRGSSFIYTELVYVTDWQIDHVPGVFDFGFSPDMNLPIAPPELFVEVDFAVGVTGQVYRRTVV